MPSDGFVQLRATMLGLLVIPFLVANTASAADPPDRCPCFSAYEVAGIGMAATDIECLDFADEFGYTNLFVHIVAGDRSLAQFVARGGYCHSYLGRLNHLKVNEEVDKTSACTEVLERAAAILYERTGFCEIWCPSQDVECRSTY